MTEFQKKRLEYFKKAAEKSEWVRLGPDDVAMLEQILGLQEKLDMADETIRQQDYCANMAGIEISALQFNLASVMQELEKLKGEKNGIRKRTKPVRDTSKPRTTLSLTNGAIYLPPIKSPKGDY